MKNPIKVVKNNILKKIFFILSFIFNFAPKYLNYIIMKRLLIQLVTVLLLLPVFSFHCFGADTYTLEYKLEKGKSFKQKIITTMSMKMNAMGQNIDINTISDLTLKFEVLGQNNGVFDVQASYVRVKTNTSSPMGTFAIDSDSPETSFDRSVGDVFKSIVGIPIDFQINKKGKVTSVKGVEKITEKLNVVSNDQFKQMFDQQFSENSIQVLFDQMISSFPEKSVAIGESWDISENLNANGLDLISKRKLTLKQVKDNIATVDCVGTLTTPEGGSNMKIQGMEATVSMKGEQSGTLKFDLKTGWTISSDISQISDQDISIMGQSMKQKIETKVTVTTE